MHAYGKLSIHEIQEVSTGLVPGSKRRKTGGPFLVVTLGLFQLSM